MKKLITNYTFDASEKKITFTDYTIISLASVLLVTNSTDHIIIYNFADAAKSGTVATNVLTLTYDTTGMADADKLQIYYDEGENYTRKYYTSAGAATDGIIWSPAANTRWHVVTMYIQVSAAATVTLEDDKAGGDDPIWKGEIAANSGVVLSFTERYPMVSGEDAADLTITTSAGNVYVTCVGYEI